MDLARLLAEAAGLTPAQAAARYAAAGVPVFPCVPGEKRPLTEHGFHDATTDPRTVQAWWMWSPPANIGIPTGQVSGIDVVDIDRYTTDSGFAALGRARRARLTTGWAALVRTPSGGIHAYYPAHDERRQASWSAPKVRIDFRGDGGYVLAPPSAVGTPSQSTGYALMARSKRPALPVDADRLHSFLDPLPTALPSPRRPQPVNVDGLARWVAARGEGERNRALFWAACRAAESGIPPDELHAILGPAAHQAGLEPREAAATIRSALRTFATRGGPGKTSPARESPSIEPPENGPVLS
jgi:hypothetical protein